MFDEENEEYFEPSSYQEEPDDEETFEPSSDQEEPDDDVYIDIDQFEGIVTYPEDENFGKEPV